MSEPSAKFLKVWTMIRLLEDGKEKACHTRVVTELDYDMALSAKNERIAELERERAEVVKALGCHPAYLMAELGQIIERAERSPNADDYRQLKAQLADYKRVLPIICCEGGNPNCMGPSGCLLAAMNAEQVNAAPQDEKASIKLASDENGESVRASPAGAAPDNPPCDCIDTSNGYFFPACYCHNTGSLMHAQDWCTRKNMRKEPT